MGYACDELGKLSGEVDARGLCHVEARQVVEHVGEPLALVLPRHIKVPQGVLQGLVAHRHLAREGLLVEVHERTAQLEVLGEVVGPVHAEHGLALHIKYGVALHRHVHRSARIEDALVDDGHRTHGVVHGVVAVLGERDATGGDLHRAARHIVGTQLDDIAARAGMLAPEEELVLLGYLLGDGLGGVVELLEHVLVGHPVVAYHATQVLAEGLDDGEDDAARRGLHGVALDVVVEAVGVGILLGVEAVEVHELEESLTLQVGLGQVGEVGAGAVALILDDELEVLGTDAVGPEGVDVLHHEVPRGVRGR